MLKNLSSFSLSWDIVEALKHLDCLQAFPLVDLSNENRYSMTTDP